MTSADFDPAGAGAGPVLLFDGECGLCARCVRFLLRIDRRARLRFAPLQGSLAQDYLRARGLPTEDFDSMIFVRDWSRRAEMSPLFRTDALLAALREVGGVGRAFAWLGVLPAAWRDPFYRLVARWRYRLFGTAERRTLHEHPKWADRFLD